MILERSRIFLISISIFFIFSQYSLAAPVVTGVSGDVGDGNSITITGTGFLSGPSVKLFETFDESGKTSGDNSTASGPRYGSWTSVSISPIIYSNVSAVTGDYAGLVYSSQAGRQNKLSFSDTREFFISYWVKIPSGSCFPGSESTKTLPTISAWKFAWISDGEDGGVTPDDDLCLPTYVGNNSWMIDGNDYTYSYVTVSWVWDEWIRISVFIKADSSDPVNNNGTSWFQTIDNSNGIHQETKTDKPLFDSDDNAGDNSTFWWNWVNVPGWIVSGYNCPAPLYDDIYIASGDNARARVEIGDTNSYSTCKKLTLLTPTSWSTEEIQATVNSGLFSSGDTAYLYVTDSNGVVNSTGYNVTFDSGSTTVQTKASGNFALH